MKKWIIIVSIIIVIAVGTIVYYKHDLKNPKKVTVKMTEVEFHNPEKFENYTNDEDYVSYGYNSKNTDISCLYHIDIDNYNSYTTGREYLGDRITFSLNDEVGEIEEKTVNGIVWNSLKVVENNKYSQSTTYYYVTLKNEKTYVFEYKINDYQRGDYGGETDDYCEKSLDEVLSSIKIK